MAGSGERTPYFNNYITPKCLIREAVNAADPTDLDSFSDGEFSNQAAKRGDNNVVFLYVLPESTVTSCTVQLWVSAHADDIAPSYGVDATEQCSGSSSSSSSSGETWAWCKVGESTVTEPTLVRFDELPPGRYKVVVSAYSGSGLIDIYESHTI